MGRGVIYEGMRRMGENVRNKEPTREKNKNDEDKSDPLPSSANQQQYQRPLPTSDFPRGNVKRYLPCACQFQQVRGWKGWWRNVWLGWTLMLAYYMCLMGYDETGCHGISWNVRCNVIQ